MSILLDRTERRVLASLVEKEFTVPESYPLTLNALVLACNQKSNRDPEMSLAEHEVAGAVRSLMDRGWVHEMELAGGRTRRYAHRAGEQLGLDAHGLSILAELLLRGPQSSTELEKRAARMRPFSGLADVEQRLEAMAKLPVPFVRLLGRRHGERLPRWEHLLGSEPPEAGGAPASPAAPAVATPVAPAAAGGATPSLAEIVARLERLEREVAALRRASPHGEGETPA